MSFMYDSLPSTAALHKNMEYPAQYLRDLRDSMAPNTRSAYSEQLRTFASWCEASCRSSLSASPGSIARMLKARASERSIMNQTVHRRTEALREYYERKDAAKDNAASLI